MTREHVDKLDRVCRWVLTASTKSPDLIRQTALDLLLAYSRVGELSAQDVAKVAKFTKDGYRINAIKHVRTVTGMGLADAKKWVDTAFPLE